MPWLIPILTKLALWALPKLAGGIVDRIQRDLLLVESAEQMADTKARRNYILRTLVDGSGTPEWLARVEVEVGVMLYRLGLTPGSLGVLETLVADKEAYASGASGSTKRKAVLEEFLKLCPTVSENAARLLIQVVVAKVKQIPPNPPLSKGGIEETPLSPPVNGGKQRGRLDVTNPPRGGSGVPKSIPPHNCDGEPTRGVSPLCCGKCDEGDDQ